jgi:hypothetical protein
MMLSLQQLAATLGGNVSGDQVLAPGPGHSPKDRSMSVKLGFDDYIVFSHAGDDWKVCRDYIDEKIGASKWEPRRAAPDDDIISRMNARASGAKQHSKPAAYVYHLADGTPYVRVNRTAIKGFWQEHWTGSEWLKGAPKGPKVPYRLPEILTNKTAPVLIVEGEKDADNLFALGFLATTNTEGAGKFTAAMAQYFADRDVYILPDNDPPGADHARGVTGLLTGIARSIRVVSLPGLPEKGDVSNWIEAGGTAEQLADILRRAEPDSPEAEAPSPDKLIKSSAEFLADFIPPDYLIDGLLQRRFIYSMTAPTGSGKTAVALMFAAHTALGRAIGEYGLEGGRVLYFAGENPDDVRMRWLAMADHMDFDIGKIDVHFLPGTPKLSETTDRIKAEVEKIGPVVLVIVDTSAAYFEGDDENGNVQAGTHARRLRGLVTLPGGPCVLVPCHPVKNATPDNMQPRGGGAFIAEMDGNLTVSKSDSLVTPAPPGKVSRAGLRAGSFRSLHGDHAKAQRQQEPANSDRDCQANVRERAHRGRSQHSERRGRPASSRSRNARRLLRRTCHRTGLGSEGPQAEQGSRPALRQATEGVEVHERRAGREAHADRKGQKRSDTVEEGFRVASPRYSFTRYSAI